MRKPRKLVFVAAAVGLALALSACTGNSGAPTENNDRESVKIGLNIPLSGTVSYLGEGFLEGAQLAVEEINAAGGAGDVQLEIVTADGQCAPAAAVTAARQLKDIEQVDVMMGEICSSAGLAVMELLDELQIANLGVSMTSPAITEQSGVGGNEWAFRLNVSDSIMAETYARLIAENAESVAIMGSNDDFGRGVAETYRAQFEGLGVETSSINYFEHGEADYRAVLSQIKSSDPDALILAMETADADIFMRQFREIGLDQEVFARGTVVNAQFLDLIADDPSLGEGIREASMWAAVIDTPQNVALNEAYQEKFNKPTTLTGAMAYYGVHTIAAAIAESGATDAVGIRDALKTVSFESGIGPVKFDEHHQAHPFVVISRIENGKIVLDQLVEN